MRLTDPKEIEIFDKLIDDMRVCQNCGHISAAKDIPHDVYCLSREQGLGYVEVVCPKCGDVQVVLPLYASFPSCQAAFEKKFQETGIDPGTEEIPSKLGMETIQKLREDLKGKVIDGNGKREEEKRKQQARKFL